MIRRIIVIVILCLLVSSCGAAATSAPTATEAPATEPPAALTEAPPESLIVESTASPLPLPSSTPEPTPTPSITPTDTQLPPLELPTEAPNAPAKMVWDGAPTYLGDSTPGYMFRVTYDPDVWAATLDQFGFPALGHRNIPYCVISVTAGRGMPANVNVEHDVLYAGAVTFDVATAYESGIKKSVTYTGGDGVILTAFEVSFQDDAEACIADAVTVLSTLRSVPASQATPQP
jgi:hypothetical protein